ncbi:MAG TPA: hypothetical protein VIN58_04705 [Roseateles sp.]
MQPFKRNYLQHALAISRWLGQHGASAGIDPATYVMDIRLGGRTVRFFPQFSTLASDGLPAFSPELSDGVSGFVGWLPYFNKRWPIAQDKLAFKVFARAQGLRTPAWSGLNGPGVEGPVLVKRQQSTFGRGMLGPFPNASDVSLTAGDYIEAFITGRIVKAWYWNSTPIVVEAVTMPTVTGDGASSLCGLIAASLKGRDTWPDGLDTLARLQGFELDAIVPAGHTVLSDYRYMSPLNPTHYVDHNVWPAVGGSALGAQLLPAGEACATAIPAEVRGGGTMFSLDGIEDANGRLWFLEANCNPQLHPACYPWMLNAIFERKH